jgi:TetR/AcrR family transcriptional regulator
MRSRVVSTRRLGVENSETRAQLIEVAMRLIRDEGCAAVTAGRLAEEVGLKRQSVHYYFGTIEELLVAVIRSSIEKVHTRARRVLESDEPLRVIWELGAKVTPVVFEFSAMAVRSEAIRAEMKRYVEEFRRIEAQALARHLELRGIKPSIPPIVTAIVINGISHALAMERALGISEGHAETKAFIEDWLRAFAQQGATPSGYPQPEKARAVRQR